MKFPGDPNIVYVIWAEKNNVSRPIYVGESTRNIGRMGDYVSSRFSATTDFKVGCTIKYLKQKGFDITFKYKNSSDRNKEEKELIKSYKNRYILLNDLPGYNPKLANIEEEKARIEEFIDAKLIA
jgi:hypothetical protein